MITNKNDIFSFLTKSIYNYNHHNFYMPLYYIENRDTLKLIKGFIKHYTFINLKIDSCDIALRNNNYVEINKLIICLKVSLRKLTQKIKLLFKSRDKNKNLILLKQKDNCEDNNHDCKDNHLYCIYLKLVIFIKSMIICSKK